MSKAKRLIFVALATIALTAPAWAGGSSYASNRSSDDPWTDLAVKVRQPKAYHGVTKAAMFPARALETFLHWPRILAETLYGDRRLVSRKGVLALPETPIEDQIYSGD